MYTDINKIIKRLKDCVEKSGFSYVELEKKTGIAKSSIQRYCSGSTKKIPIDAVQAIAEAVGVEAKYIMGWEEETTSIRQYKKDSDIDIMTIIENYKSLNDEGKKKLIEYSDDLVSSKKYIKDKYVTVVKAARNKDKQHSIEKVQMTEDELSIFDIAPQSDEDL